jgi:hypothetical protein
MANFLGWIYTEGFENSAHTFMARLRGNSFALITQATISSITCKVYDRSSATPGTPVSSPTVVVASAIFDTLQTDGRWTVDSSTSPGSDGSAGYNFLHQVVGSVFSEGGKTYDVEYTFTPTAGEAIVQGFRHTTYPISSA